MRYPAALRTTAARLSALFLLLFTICSLVLVFYMTSLSVRMLTAQTKETIAEEVQGLSSMYSNGGLPALVRSVEQRSRAPGANLYLIANPSGQILTGNVANLELPVLAGEGWTAEPFSYVRYGEDRSMAAGGRSSSTRPGNHQAIAQIFHLPNQMILLVGRDLTEPERLREIVRQSIIIAVLIMSVGGLLIWFFVGQRGLQRLDAVSAASKRIMGGDLSGRLPVTEAGDEFDRLSETLNSMIGRIGELNEGLKQVADNIAHDLKTPISRIRTRAETALADKEEGRDMRETLEQTIAECDQLIAAFGAILKISRLEAGNSIEETTQIDLSELVADVCELYEPVAEDENVALSCAVAEGVSVQGNRELISQALCNIIENGLKYGKAGDRDPSIAIVLEQRDETAVIEVTDNGPGIPQQDRERVTERFVRLDRSRTLPGSGLGLALVKAVAMFHRGRLILGDGEPGLSVRLCLPLSTPIEPKPSAQAVSTTG